MLQPIFEGKLDIFLKSDALLTAGQLVKLDTANAGKILAVSTGSDDVYGVVAQDVVDPKIDNFKLDSVTHKAYLGQKVGVYIGDGMYYTDQYSGNVSVGAKLYPGAGGKLTATAGVAPAYAVAETAGTGAAKIRIRVF